MRIPRIYYSQDLNLDTEITLEADAANHVGRVLRLSSGAAIILFNGLGGEYRATLTESGKKTVKAHISHFDDICVESPLKIHLGRGIKTFQFRWQGRIWLKASHLLSPSIKVGPKAAIMPPGFG